MNGFCAMVCLAVTVDTSRATRADRPITCRRSTSLLTGTSESVRWVRSAQLEVMLLRSRIARLLVYVQRFYYQARFFHGLSQQGCVRRICRPGEV